MPNYSPELVASVLHDYQYTDKPTRQIAAEHHINERDVTRIRHAAGVATRRARMRELPAEMREAHEITTRLMAEALPAADVGRNTRGEAEHIAPSAAQCAALTAPYGSELGLPAVIARVLRLVEQELTAEEATRTALGSLARTPTELERCARTVASMTRTLHVLLRMRASAAPEQAPFNHDLPEDADECRNELARRVEAFLASRETDGSDERAAGAATVARS